MPIRIKDLRNFDLNIYGYIASGLRAQGFIVLSGYNNAWVTSGIYVVDGFPEGFEDLKTPSVAIEHESSRAEELQLGPGKKNIRKYSIIVYARTDGERDDLGETIYGLFDSTMTIYDYNSVLTAGTYQKVGIADFTNVTMRPLRDNSYESLKHQMNISFNSEICIDSGNSLV